MSVINETDNKKPCKIELDSIESESESESFVKSNRNERELVSVQWSDAWPQMYASLCAYAIVIQGGVNLAYSAVLLPQLTEPGSDFVIGNDEASWIASLVTISLSVGALSLGYLMDKFGRKKICFITCVPFIFSWILVATAQTVFQLYVARILAGIGAGLSTVSLVYVSEICHPTFRPMLLGLNSVAVSFGILITCVLGFWCNWRTMAFVYCILSILSALVLIPLPESPHWYATFKNDLDQISKSLHWLYKREQIYDQQYNQILNNNHSKFPLEFNASAHIYTEPIVYKPVLILVLLLFLQQFSGCYVIIFYAVDIFRRVGGPFLNEYISLILLGGIRFVLSVISSLLSKRCGRRLLLTVSGIGMCLTTACVAVHTAWFRDCGEAGSLSLVPVGAVLAYVCSGSLGYLIIPWTLIGELLPVKVRATMGGVMVTWAYVCMFVVVKSFPHLIDLIGLEVMFAFFAVVSFVSVLFVYFFLPETLGKTFTEIEEYFR